MRSAVLLVAIAGCTVVQIDADGATRVRALGAVRVETRACDAPPAALVLPGSARAFAGVTSDEPHPARTCVRIEGTSLSEVAGGLAASIVRSLIGGRG